MFPLCRIHHIFMCYVKQLFYTENTFANCNAAISSYRNLLSFMYATIRFWVCYIYRMAAEAGWEDLLKIYSNTAIHPVAELPPVTLPSSGTLSWCPCFLFTFVPTKHLFFSWLSLWQWARKIKYQSSFALLQLSIKCQFRLPWHRCPHRGSSSLTISIIQLHYYF